MGSEYVVQVWTNEGENGYHYKEVWRGESREKALKFMDKQRGKYGCIVLEWRP